MRIVSPFVLMTTAATPTITMFIPCKKYELSLLEMEETNKETLGKIRIHRGKSGYPRI